MQSLMHASPGPDTYHETIVDLYYRLNLHQHVQYILLLAVAIAIPLIIFRMYLQSAVWCILVHFKTVTVESQTTKESGETASVDYRLNCSGYYFASDSVCVHIG